MLGISLSWSTIVGFLGLEDDRIWSSFFLQYLWEFGLGMMIADYIFNFAKTNDSNIFLEKSLTKKWLFCGAILGVSISGLMAWSGGFLKMYNDIPSLVGYISISILIFKLHISHVNHFFEWINKFSYELYLIHTLVFSLSSYIFYSFLPIAFVIPINLVLAYFVSYYFSLAIRKIKLIQ